MNDDKLKQLTRESRSFKGTRAAHASGIIKPTGEVVNIIKRELDDCDHPECETERKRRGFSSCAGGHLARRVVAAVLLHQKQTAKGEPWTVENKLLVEIVSESIWNVQNGDLEKWNELRSPMDNNLKREIRIMAKAAIQTMAAHNASLPSRIEDTKQDYPFDATSKQSKLSACREPDGGF